MFSCARCGRTYDYKHQMRWCCPPHVSTCRTIPVRFARCLKRKFSKRGEEMRALQLEGLSFYAIAKKLSCSHERVRQLLNAGKPKDAQRQAEIIRVARQRAASMLSMRDDGATYREVAEAFGISGGRASALINQALSRRAKLALALPWFEPVISIAGCTSELLVLEAAPLKKPRARKDSRGRAWSGAARKDRERWCKWCGEPTRAKDFCDADCRREHRDDEERERLSDNRQAFLKIIGAA